MRENNYNRIIAIEDLKGDRYFYVSDLIEKRKYIHFYCGPIGRPKYPCIKEPGIAKKELFTWKKTRKVCENGSSIFKVTRR